MQMTSEMRSGVVVTTSQQLRLSPATSCSLVIVRWLIRCRHACELLTQRKRQVYKPSHLSSELRRSLVETTADACGHNVLAHQCISTLYTNITIKPKL